MEINGPHHDPHCSWFVLDNGPDRFQTQYGRGGEEEDPHFCQKLKQMLSSPLTFPLTTLLLSKCYISCRDLALSTIFFHLI
jgi:hypothetical protein